MPVSTLQLFHMVGYDHPLLLVALHGILVHFCGRELLFSHMNVIYEQGSQHNDVEHEMRMLHCTYTPI